MRSETCPQATARPFSSPLGSSQAGGSNIRRCVGAVPDLRRTTCLCDRRSSPCLSPLAEFNSRLAASRTTTKLPLSLPQWRSSHIHAILCLGIGLAALGLCQARGQAAYCVHG